MSQAPSAQLPFIHVPFSNVSEPHSPHRLQSALYSQPSPWSKPNRPHVRVQPPHNMNMSSDSPLSRQRNRWFSTEMRKQRSVFTNDKDLVLFTGTWNVNGRDPEPSADLKQWLFPRESQQPCDVYMLGLQEVQPLAGVDALRTDPNRGLQWRKRIHLALGTDYDQVAEHQLVGILVVVFMRKNHTPFLTEIQLAYAATGFLNALGNKGGVAARFQLYNQTISCVACHLAAHTENVERRNQDFRDVVRKAVFLPNENRDYSSTSTMTAIEGSPFRNSSDSNPPQLKTPRPPPASSMSNLPAVAAGTSAWLGSVASQAASAFSDMSAGANAAILSDPNAMKILDHDAVFWLGDLNYRVDAPLNDVMKWIHEKNWEALYRADQLQNQMKTCDIFTGFKEGRLRFPPTYKLNRNRNEYAVDENGEVKRVPAYTDRILWKTGGGKEDTQVKVQLQEYNSAPSVYSSDHRPVYALFKMTFGVEDAARRKDVETRINRELDTREESFRPSLKFSSTAVDFGDVFFDKKCARSISVQNLGGIAATLTVETSHEKPRWLVFDAQKWRSIELPPGKSVSLEVGVHVAGRDGIANRVSSHGCALETVLNVFAEPGRLHESIQLRGKYVATTYGLSLETLSMLGEPVLSMRVSTVHNRDHRFSQHPKESEHEHRKGPGVVPLPIPKEIWLLVDALLRVHDDDHDIYMNRYPGIFLRDGEEVDTQRVLSFIDRGESIPNDVSGYAVAACMVNVLKNLNDPVIPRYATKRAIEAGHTEDPEMVHAVVDLLPPLNANVFWYVIGFLCETPSVRSREDRGHEVAEVFGRVLLATDEKSHSREHRYRTAFILGAMRYQQRMSEPAYRAIIDLAHPISHPKNISSRILG